MLDFSHLKKILSENQREFDLESGSYLQPWHGVVLCVLHQDGFFIVKRSHRVPTHRGDLAFVGGHRHPEENNPWDVARREWEEETHIDFDGINKIGLLKPHPVSKQKMIIPVVGHLEISKKNLKEQLCSNGEWDIAMFVPLAPLMVEKSWNVAVWQKKKPADFCRESAKIFYRPIELSEREILNISDFNRLELNSPFLLWGFTARIVWEFIQLIK